MANAAETIQSTSETREPPKKIITVYLQTDVINFLELLVTKYRLFPSRSEVIRYLITNGLPALLEIAEKLENLTPETIKEFDVVDLKDIPLDMRTLRNATIIGKSNAKPRPVRKNRSSGIP